MSFVARLLLWYMAITVMNRLKLCHSQEVRLDKLASMAELQVVQDWVDTACAAAGEPSLDLKIVHDDTQDRIHIVY